jgi:hypothetical protein
MSELVLIVHKTFSHIGDIILRGRLKSLKSNGRRDNTKRPWPILFRNNNTCLRIKIRAKIFRYPSQFHQFLFNKHLMWSLTRLTFPPQFWGYLPMRPRTSPRLLSTITTYWSPSRSRSSFTAWRDGLSPGTPCLSLRCWCRLLLGDSVTLVSKMDMKVINKICNKAIIRH